MSTDELDDLTERLEDAAAQLRGGELTPEDAAKLVEECASLAAQAGTELDRLGREQPAPGQDSLL
jgi:hypothetical protein